MTEPVLILIDASIWVLSGSFLISFSYLIYRHLRTNNILQNLMGFIFLWIFWTSIYVLVLGLAGWLTTLGVGITSAFAISVMGLHPSSREALREGLHDLKGFMRRAREWWRTLPPWIRWLFGLFAIYSIVRFTFLTWALPPFVWDSLTYHLTNIAYWIQAGRIELFETPIHRIYSPANYEVFAAWFTVFLHHDAFIEASGIPAYILAGIAVYALGRQIGLGREAAVLGAVGYASTPALVLAITGTKNDPIMAALYLMGLSIVLDISMRANERPERNYSGQFMLLIMLAFYALGTKTYLLSLAPGFIILAILASAYSGRLFVWLEPFKNLYNKIQNRKFSALLLQLILLLTAVFIGSFWYLRNWILTGNALFPYNLTFSANIVAGGGSKNAFVAISTLIENFQVLYEKFFDRQFAVMPDLPRTTGWGWLAYGLGIPSAIWAFVRWQKYRILTVGFLSSLIFLYLSSTTSPFNMRYQIWVPALLCVGAALFLDWMPQELRAARTLYAGLFVVCVLLNLLMTVNYNRVPIEKFQQMLALPLWEREAGLFRINMPEEYEIALRTVPEDEVLGYNVHPNGFVYPLFRANYSQKLVYIPLELEYSCDQIESAMRVRGTRWLFVAPEHTDDEIIALLEGCALLEDPIRERDGGLFVIDD